MTRLTAIFTSIVAAGALASAMVMADTSTARADHLFMAQDEQTPQENTPAPDTAPDDTMPQDTPQDTPDGGEDTAPEENTENGEGPQNDPFVRPMPEEETPDMLDEELQNAEMTEAQTVMQTQVDDGFMPVAAGRSMNGNTIVFFQNPSHDWRLIVMSGENANVFEEGTDLRAADYYAYGMPIEFSLAQQGPPGAPQQPQCSPMQEYVRIPGDENGAYKPLFSQGASILVGTLGPNVTLNVIFNDSEWEMIRIERGTGYGEELACPLSRGAGFHIVEPPAPASPEQEPVILQDSPRLDL